MINLVDIGSDHVLGVRIHQNLLATDIDLAMNFLEKKVRTRENIALYAEIEGVADVDFDVLQKELAYGAAQLKSLSHIDRVAIVTDVSAISDNETLVGLIPGIEVKTYAPSEKESAKTWVKQPLPASPTP